MRIVASSDYGNKRFMCKATIDGCTPWYAHLAQIESIKGWYAHLAQIESIKGWYAHQQFVQGSKLNGGN